MKKPYSNILVALLKGIVYNHNDSLWEALLLHEPDIKKYFGDIHLDLVIDKSEGYAFLKQGSGEDQDMEILRLIEKRQLSFPVSLLCLLLRKHLIENDREGKSVKAVLTKEEILNMVKPFYRETSNEAKQTAQIEAAIKKVVDEGFIRRMKTEEEQYEINRIIKAFIHADVVKSALDKLKNYAEQSNDE